MNEPVVTPLKPVKCNRKKQPPKPNPGLTPSVGDKFSTFNYEQSKVVAAKLDEAMGESDFQILSTIRFDPTLSGGITSNLVCEENFFLLPTHWKRLQFTIGYFGWDVDVPYDHLVKELIATVSTLDPMLPYKLRVLVSKENVLNVEAYATVPRVDLFSGLHPQAKNEPIYKVYLDSHYTIVSPFTSFKTTKRDHYNLSRQRTLVNNGDLEEVLIYNSCNEIMEGSITNVAFQRDNKWVTPSILTGCLCGVVRHHLLSTDVLYEGKILKSNVKIGEPVLLFNGIIGVCRGIICERLPPTSH
jgi:4-amino-4-deoxychorismate lyase